MGFLEKIFGNYSEKEIKKIKPIVAKIEALGPQYENLSDEELRGKTQEFKDRLAKGETLDDILPEAYAVVREAVISQAYAARRSLLSIPFRMQPTLSPKKRNTSPIQSESRCAR